MHFNWSNILTSFLFWYWTYFIILILGWFWDIVLLNYSLIMLSRFISAFVHIVVQNIYSLISFLMPFHEDLHHACICTQYKYWQGLQEYSIYVYRYLWHSKNPGRPKYIEQSIEPCKINWKEVSELYFAPFEGWGCSDAGGKVCNVSPSYVYIFIY